MCALAVVLGYAEALLPPIVPVAGFKIGIANIAVMYVLERFGAKQGFFVMGVKVLVTSLWFSGLNALIYSAAGGILSWAAMIGAKRLKMSAIGIGMSGGVFHNIGQLAAACAVLGTGSSMWFAPMLLPLGLLSGFFVGTVTRLLLRYTIKHK